MKAKLQSGFSIVELMVSIMLGLILMAGILSIFFSSKVTYFANEKTARLQENGRVALDFVTHDIRASGYGGCARGVPFTSTLNTPTALLWSYAFPLQGFESVQLRQPHVHQRDVGAHLAIEFQSFLAAGGLSDNLDFGVRREHGHEPLPDDQVVIHEHHTNLRMVFHDHARG